jgi:hypothetical protein
MGHRLRPRCLDNSLMGERVSTATYPHLGIPVALVASRLRLDLHSHSNCLGVVR